MISIAWASGIIYVPKSFLTPLGGSTYELDLDAFRLALKDLEDDEAGMPWPKTHNHDTEVSLAGITFARKIEIVPPYRVEFEDGVYGVNLVGANSNIPDVLVRNSVSVNSQNSAGLIVMQDAGVDQATVQAAMTAQGYTAARAPLLDHLDADVSGVGLTNEQATMLLEMYRLLGLDPSRPLVVSQNRRRVPADGSYIDQAISDVSGTVTVTRQ